MIISFPKVTIFFTTFAKKKRKTRYLRMLRITWKQKNPVSPEPVKRPVASCELSTYYIVL